METTYILLFVYVAQILLALRFKLEIPNCHESY